MALPEPLPSDRLSPEREDVSQWQKELWDADLEYEVRALKLVTRCARAENNRILCGDKSGRVAAHFFGDGKVDWTASPRDEAGHRLLGGPVYDLALVHPLEDASKYLDPERQTCLVAVGAGNDELTFLNYLDGRPENVEFEDGSRAWLHLGSSILSLLYVESCRELWAGLAGGGVARLAFDFEEGMVRCRRLPAVDLGEAVSALCFMPGSPERAGEEYRRGWICAATMLGNVYSLDPDGPCLPQEPILRASGPIQACISLSRVVARYGWEGSDVFAVTYGGSVKYYIHQRPDGKRSAWQESVLDWPCADRVFCLSWADLEDAAWLVVGANDKRLHFCRVLSRESEGKSPSHCFGDLRFSIKLPERVREIAVREVPGQAGANLYAALGDHRIKALHLLSIDLFRDRIQKSLPASDLRDIQDWLSKDPYDPVLRRNLISLLFRAGWLSSYLKRHPLDNGDERRLKLIVYHLLAGSKPLICREIQSGILAAAKKPENAAFRPLAIELARHIGKYSLDGLSFSDKSRNLDRLAEFNESNDREYLYDAAIYRSLLAERRHTEREGCELPYPITSLQTVDLPGLGGHRLLATSYHEGAVWLIEKGDWPRLTFKAPGRSGKAAEWIQQVVVWTDPSSAARYAIFFYRDQGWTWCNMDTLDLQPNIQLLAPRQIYENESFYIYSVSKDLPNGLIAAGGRCADVTLLRIEVAAGRPELRILQSVEAIPEQRYAPIRASCFRQLESDRGELFAGCDNGACYCFPFNGKTLDKPYPVYQLPDSIRVVTARGTDHLILGDGSDALALLRRLDPRPEKGESIQSFIPEWIARLDGAAITGLLETRLSVPSASEPHRTPEPRIVSVVSDSLGALHVLDFGKRPEHSFALPLDGSPPIDHMVLYPAEGAAAGDETQVAVACFDKTVRVLRLIHRRESVRHLNKDISRAVIAALQKVLDLPAATCEMAERVLRDALDEQVFVIEIARRMAQALSPASASEREVAWLEEEILGTFQEIAWKLASVNVQSESTTVMSLRLRYDDPEAFPRLLDELIEMSSGTKPVPAGRRPNLRLRYWLRFAFKIIAYRLGTEDPPDARFRGDLAKFVHSCHDLCRSWGPDQSKDELRCKLAISHMLFRFANRRTLECLLGDELADALGEIKGKSMGDFLKDLLDETRLAISFRMIQHIRRMVDRDEGENLKGSVIGLIAPLLVGRFRECQFTPHDAWLGTEIYLCLHMLERQYGYSQWSLVSALFENGCSLTLLAFLAERQRVLPPNDPSCRDVVAALDRAETVSAGDSRAFAARRIVFDRLTGARREGILECVRILTAVAIAFDSSSDPDLHKRAHAAVLQAQVETMTLPESVSRADVEQLLDCARGLIRLLQTPANMARRKLYRGLRQGLDRLRTPRAPAALEAGLLESDVVRKIFLEGWELVRRQAEIEFDFVAPLLFLQEQSFAGDEIADEQMLAHKLLDFAKLQGDLFQSAKTMLLIRDATAGAVILHTLGEEEAQVTLASRGQIRRRMEAFLSHLKNKSFVEESFRLLDAEPAFVSASQYSPLDLGHDLLGEIIPIDREGELYGLLFFAYDRYSAPDPSKRALARMIPQILVSEFMRSIQTQRLLALTFHHISAPIAAMRVMLQNLVAGYIEAAEQGSYFENLWFYAEDCRLMIDNNQNYVRMVRGIAPPVLLERFDLAAEAEFRRKIVQYKYKGSQQIVRWSSDHPTTEVYLDRMMVGDIIQNLLDNACKYSPARTEIQLSIQGRKRNVFIKVSDEGPGLPEDVSLYREGVRSEAAAKSNRPGLGLGLFMVRRYVEWLDGDVWYDTSQTGTTFTVRLPREAEG